MDDKAIRGIRWTVLGHGAGRVASLLTTFVLAHLLVPRDFGMVAFSSLVIAGLLLFGTLGLGSAIVVRQDLDRVQLRTALTLMITAHLACAVVIVAASPLVGALLDEPRAGGVLRGLTIPVLLGGVTHFYASVMQRELQFSRQVACMAGQVIGVAVTSIPLAASGVGVWSLVIGQITGAVVYTTLLVVLSPYRVGLGFHRRTARTLWGSGWGFMLQGGVSFVEQNADFAVIGTKLGAKQLGVYSMAYRISEVPANFIVEPVAHATFPGFARMHRGSEDVTDAFLTSLRLVALCAFPLGLIVSGAADPLVKALFGPEWSGMVGLLQILGLWGSLRILHATTGWFVNSMGYSSRVGTSYAAMLIVGIPVLVLAADLGAAKGVAWAMVGNVIVMTAIVGRIAARHVGIPARRQFDAVKTSALAALPAWLSASGAATALDIPAGAALIVSVASGGAAYIGTVWLLDRTLLAEARTYLRRTRTPRQTAR